MSAEQKDKKHYHGHRDRLRQRFVTGGADALADYELLELILFMAIPRRDVKPLAKTLLERFGGLPQLMAASHHELTQIDGISENTAIAIQAISAVSLRTVKQEIMRKPILNNWTRLMDYCYAAMKSKAAAPLTTPPPIRAKL